MTDPQTELAEDLRQYIHEICAAGPHKNVRWVMNPEWFGECRRLDAYAAHWVMNLDFLKERPETAPDPGATVGRMEFLLGIPIEVRDDGGVPHLEPAGS
jgi:hypothetical protein